MAKVLVVYGSRHGGTRGIAERIGEVLRTRGLEADVAAADKVADVRAADAFVVGSGVYMGSWLKEAIDFIKRNEATLAARPLWLFSSGPLPGSSASKSADDPMADALGPAEGPGAAAGRRSPSSAPRPTPVTTASSSERSTRRTRRARCPSGSFG